MKFQLDTGEILEVNKVLFVPGTKVSRLSMSSLEDVGYGLFVKTGQIFLYQIENRIGTTILLGNRRDGLYFLQGEVMFPGPGGRLSKTESEDEAGAHMIPSDEESYMTRDSASMKVVRRCRGLEGIPLTTLSLELFFNMNL